MTKLFLFLCLAVPTQGELQTRYSTSFVVFAADANANPPMCFGGKLLSEMDRCAGITARRLLYSSLIKDAVTVAINDVKFHKAAQVKDLLIVSAVVEKASGKSIVMHVKIEREIGPGASELIVEGKFVFVSFDVANKVAMAHGIEYQK